MKNGSTERKRKKRENGMNGIRTLLPRATYNPCKPKNCQIEQEGKNLASRDARLSLLGKYHSFKDKFEI